MNWDTIFPVILGAILAIIATFATGIFTKWQESLAKKAFLLRFLRVEVPSCVLRVRALVNVYNESNLVEPSFIASLERSINLFKSYREFTYSLPSHIGLEVLQFYDSISHSTEMLFSMLRLLHEGSYKDYALGEIQKQMQELELSLTIGESLTIKLINKKPYTETHSNLE